MRPLNAGPIDLELKYGHTFPGNLLDKIHDPPDGLRAAILRIMEQKPPEVPMRFILIVAILALASSVFAQTDSSPSASPSDQGSAQDSNAVQIPPPTSSQAANVDQQLKDIQFDFNRDNLRPEERQTLQADAAWLKAHPDVFVTIEGDADERGDIVYNVDLSDRRAAVTRDALVGMGISADRVVFATGWGKLYPVCNESDESCWSRNRRAHFELWGESGQAQASLQTAKPAQP
jgi:peptidoglycan-associated lipoprotein